uniref:Uncharacterized protein n=1 Tax=Arundo donax TaxID=35708 RepID=A0A0A9GYW7_ARUDO
MLSRASNRFPFFCCTPDLP